jgi:hypothetical protein
MALKLADQIVGLKHGVMRCRGWHLMRASSNKEDGTAFKAPTKFGGFSKQEGFGLKRQDG